MGSGNFLPPVTGAGKPQMTKQNGAVREPSPNYPNQKSLIRNRGNGNAIRQE